uniref:Protein kinase domain-containing protein n=1 Tax=Salix viminalis TaxID=40686 RepID=A0A6N2MEA7_SALVM
MAAVELTVFHVILLFWSLRTAESQVMALTGCESYCGGIEIPYPFGMTKGCFLDERFKIHCNSSSGVPKLTLNGTDLPVIYISVSYSTIYVKFPIAFANCGVKERSTVVDLEGSPFLFSSEDDFVERGCSNLTLMHQKNSTVGGCLSICYENRDRLIASCSGINSCQTRDPSDMIDGDSVLVVVLDWGIDRRVFESLIKNGSYNTLSYTSTCKDMNTSINSTIQTPIVQCSCNPDFEGNPYLSGICQGVGVGFGALFLFIGLWWMYKVFKRKRCEKLKKKYFKRNGGLLLQEQLSFRTLGQGGQGTVYKGMLVDGKIVGSQEIQKTELPLLVYEFIPNGTLFQFLHDPNEEFPLTWEMRLRIAAEVAGALFYLHSAASIAIFHRDIKSTNILLDEKYRAKIADFGTSRSTLGLSGVLPISQFTDKSDVYSFGVVLVELLTGQKPISFTRSEEQG